MSSVTIHLLVRDAKDRESMPRPPFEPLAKPCPFCGHENITIRQLEDPIPEDMEIFWGHCMKCKAEGPARETRRRAIDGWNGRKP